MKTSHVNHKVHSFWEGLKIFKIFTLLLSHIVPVKSYVKISQNFVAFSEYMNFKKEKNKLKIKLYHAHGSRRKFFAEFNSNGSSVAMCHCSLTQNRTEVRFLRFTGNRGLVFGLVDISTVFADIPFTVAMNELLCLKNAAPISHCFSPHTSNWRLWQLKKIKSLGPFWSYQLNSTANPAHLPQTLGQMGWIGSVVLLV